MSAAATEARERVTEIIKTAYAPEGWEAEADRIHDSLGHSGTRIGVTVERQDAMPGRQIVQRMEILVRFYGQYEKNTDPEMSVDPTTVESYAERFQQAVEAEADPGTDRLWFFNVLSIDFPDDPVGGKTRFIATLEAFGNNPSLIETTG